MAYDNNMQIILKKVVSDNPKAPTLRAEIVIDGKKYKAGLWQWDRKDGSKVLDKEGNGQYIGKVEVDTYGENVQKHGIADARKAAEPAPAVGQFDDDIPF